MYILYIYIYIYTYIIHISHIHIIHAHTNSHIHTRTRGCSHDLRLTMFTVPGQCRGIHVLRNPLHGDGIPSHGRHLGAPLSGHVPVRCLTRTPVRCLHHSLGEPYCRCCCRRSRRFRQRCCRLRRCCSVFIPLASFNIPVT